MSQLDSNLDDAPVETIEPARGVIVKKPGTTIYTVLLIIATLAMMLGCLFLFLERARYPF